MIDFKKLVKAGVHFGHQASRWVPKMSPYIWGVKNKVHLIDVSKTAHQLERASQFLEAVAAEGKQVLWIGTKKAARDIIKQNADATRMPYVDYRWVGGTLSNFAQVKKSVTSLLHYEDVLSKSEKFPHYTKKELNVIRKKVERLRVIVGGIKKLTWPVGAVVIVDVNKEQSALKEAHSMGIPVIAMVDTNADPSLVDYVIPANDDAPRSIGVVLGYLKEAVERGLARKNVEKPLEQHAKAPSEVVVHIEADAISDDIDDSMDDDEPKKKKSLAKGLKSPSVEEKKEYGADIVSRTKTKKVVKIGSAAMNAKAEKK